jgi:F-type H+-transporting ATPase subunit b
VRRNVIAIGLVLATSLALVLGAPASAQEEEPAVDQEEVIHEAEELAKENGATEFDEHCIEILVEGGSVDDCNEAPSPILPPLNEIIWGSISFFLLLFLLWKFAWPGIKKSMEARTARVADDLAVAEAAKAEAEGVLNEYRAQLADARSEAGRVIEESRQAADAMRRDLQTQAESDIAAMRQKAAADIEAAKLQAIADLRGEVANIAIGAAERVVEHSLDRDTNIALVENYINQVGAGTAS